MAVDGGKFQKLAAEASGRGRPERRGLDRPTDQPSLSGNLVCKSYAKINSYCTDISAQIVCARIFCRVDSKYIGRKFQNSFAHGCTDDLPIVGRFTFLAYVHYSIPLILRIPPNIPTSNSPELLPI